MKAETAPVEQQSYSNKLKASEQDWIAWACRISDQMLIDNAAVIMHEMSVDPSLKNKPLPGPRITLVRMIIIVANAFQCQTRDTAVGTGKMSH